MADDDPLAEVSGLLKDTLGGILGEPADTTYESIMPQQPSDPPGEENLSSNPLQADKSAAENSSSSMQKTPTQVSNQSEQTSDSTGAPRGYQNLSHGHLEDTPVHADLLEESLDEPAPRQPPAIVPPSSPPPQSPSTLLPTPAPSLNPSPSKAPSTLVGGPPSPSPSSTSLHGGVSPMGGTGVPEEMRGGGTVEASGSGVGSGSGGGFPHPAGDSPASLIITVKEPEKVETQSALGLKTHYMMYTVRTEEANGNGEDAVEVRRRYSDFDALHKLLKQEFRGLVIPPLPEKSFLQGKIAPEEFIQSRRADLQAFMRILSRHPVLRDCEPLGVFVTQPGELMRNPAWTYLIHPPHGARPSPANSASLLQPGEGYGSESSPLGSGLPANLKAGLGSWMSWVKASVGHLGPAKRELSDEEVALRQAKELFLDLHRLLELATEASRGLCTNLAAVGEDVKSMGRQFAMLSRFEEAVQQKVGQYTAQGASAGARAADLNKVAYSIVKQNPIWSGLSMKTAASLVTLQDWHTLVPEAISALEVREGALNLLHILQDDLCAKQQQLEQVQAPQTGTAALQARIQGLATAPGASLERRVAQLTASIAATEEQIRMAQADYELVKSRNQSELARLSLEREADFRRMLAMFAHVQASLVRASADTWVALAKQFEGALDS